MILLYLLLGYFLFRFIVGFVIPVFRTTKTMREQFSNMNQQQGSRQGNNGSGPGTQSGGTTDGHRSPDASKVGEYIDFEEVKP